MAGARRASMAPAALIATFNAERLAAVAAAAAAEGDRDDE